jgi:hypothetical protein
MMSDWPYFITDVIYDLDHHHRSRQSWSPGVRVKSMWIDASHTESRQVRFLFPADQPS